jgi:signal transduction histidine kinase/CheY-like chemotaxis protein
MTTERRVLVLPATSTDGVAMDRLFAANAIACAVCATMTQMCIAFRQGAGAMIIAEEMLLAETDTLVDCLARQPVWSNIPVVILSRSGHESAKLSAMLGLLGDATVVERPIRTTTLVTLAKSSLRARDRQYQLREYLTERDVLLDSERAARSEVERAGRMKDEFLATLSHELRTPLNAILGWAQVLKKTADLAPDAMNAVNVIERNARSQAQIIADLLDMSSIISGKVRLDMQRLDLASVIEATIETVRPTAQAKEIRLDIGLDAQAPPLRGDPNRLQQVFWNLLTNAIKFTPKGGRVSIQLTSAGSLLTVDVADDGEGMDPAFLPHVFDRFRQADASSTRRHGGLGLGLSIVKQLVELHGGSICAASAGPALGSTFRVTLPVMTAVDDALEATQRMRVVAADESAGSDAPLASLEGIRVLVVDDEIDARELVERLLRDCGAQVHVAGSVAEAMQIVERGRPDVVVSDIGMPGEDGYALIRRLRALPGTTSRVPAIALTAYARPEDRAKALQSGFERHLSKPIDPGALVTAVADLVR